MALLSTPPGLRIVGVECLVGLDFRAMTSPRPEAVLFTFSITKFFHDFAVGRRLIFQQSLGNIRVFSLRLDNAMDSSCFQRAIDLMFHHLEWLGFPLMRYVLHERLLSFCVPVIAEHGGNGGVWFHSTVDLHFDVEPQVLLHDPRLFLRSPAGHYEPIDFEHHFDYEGGSDSQSDDDDEDPEGEAGAETEAASDGVGAQKEVCSICFDEFAEETDGHGSDVARLPCSHMFHYECISLWFQRSRTCPLCRREVD